MLSPIEADDDAPAIVADETNFGLLPSVAGRSRLESRFHGQPSPLDAVRGLIGRPLNAVDAESAGLITVASDELDWDEEIRLAIEERSRLSPDALTGLEASLRQLPGRRDPGDEDLRAASPPGRTGCSIDRTPPVRGARSSCSARAPNHNSIGSAFRPWPSITRRGSPTTSTSLRIGSCSGRSSIGSRISSTGGASLDPPTSKPPRSTCAPRSRSTAKVGPRSATSRCRNTAGASSSPSAIRTAESASATSTASRYGSRCRASSGRHCDA